MSSEFRIPDGDREVTFTGELLASATSDDGKAQRWTIFELYRTDAGRYVLHKVGRSVVYHTAESRCTRQAEPITVGQLLERDDEQAERSHDWRLRGLEAVLSYMDVSGTRLPCVTCEPPDVYDNATDTQLVVRAERDRHSVVVSESARGVIDSLHGKDGNGTLFLTRVAERLIRAAAPHDQDLRTAWEVQAL